MGLIGRLGLFMRQAGRTLTAADEGGLVGDHVLICHRGPKWSARSRPAGRGGDPRAADTVSGAECRYLRRALRAFDQARVPQPSWSRSITLARCDVAWCRFDRSAQRWDITARRLGSMARLTAGTLRTWQTLLVLRLATSRILLGSRKSK